MALASWMQMLAKAPAPAPASNTAPMPIPFNGMLAISKCKYAIPQKQGEQVVPVVSSIDLVNVAHTEPLPEKLNLVSISPINNAGRAGAKHRKRGRPDLDLAPASEQQQAPNPSKQ